MMTIVDIFDKQPVISKGALDAIYAIRECIGGTEIEK